MTLLGPRSESLLAAGLSKLHVRCLSIPLDCLLKKQNRTKQKHQAKLHLERGHGMIRNSGQSSLRLNFRSI